MDRREFVLLVDPAVYPGRLEQFKVEGLDEELITTGTQSEGEYLLAETNLTVWLSDRK